MINDESTNITDLKLCYVCPRDRFAWFSSIPLESQWGDDWNDAPYEHNAGDPYEHTYTQGSRERIEHHLVKVAWDGPFSTPADLAGCNSSWSVQGINRGCVAWLIPDGWGASDSARPIPAGTSLVDFIKAIDLTGGNVYLPQNISCQINAIVRDEKLKALGFEETSEEQRAANLEVTMLNMGK